VSLKKKSTERKKMNLRVEAPSAGFETEAAEGPPRVKLTKNIQLGGGKVVVPQGGLENTGIHLIGVHGGATKRHARPEWPGGKAEALNAKQSNENPRNVILMVKTPVEKIEGGAGKKRGGVFHLSRNWGN